jgi:fatty-acyl-CoA synthase
VFCLGSEASPRDRSEFRRRFGCLVVEGYSSSEGGVVIQPFRGMPKDALGRPADGADVVILDPDTGAERPPARFDAEGRLVNAAEAIGEIVGRDALSAFEGYYANEEADAARSRNGWYWTGDLGYRDEAGTFWFAGRSADWLRVDGENFAAGPVERILERLPGVAAVVVYPVPDPVSGDQVMAALELDAGAVLDPAELGRFLAAQPDLGTKWAPRFVRQVTAIPLTATGKVDRQPLRRERWDTTDPIWWRPVAAEPYRRLTAADVTELRGAFADAGREGMLT